MHSQQQVSINFFPLDPQDFEFTVHRAPYVDGAARPHEHSRSYKLPRTPIGAEQQAGDWPSWWVSLTPGDGFEPFTCAARTNVQLTQYLLMNVLAERSAERLPAEDFRAWWGFDRRVEFVIEKFPDRGNRCVWLSPYYVKSRNAIGFLADFHFRRHENAPFDREVLRLSFSLDNQYRENSNFYVDRYGQLQKFISQIYGQIFPLQLQDGFTLELRKQLLRVPPRLLDKKKYVFTGGKTSNSQFMGVRENGPLTSVSATARLCFMYRPEEKPLSHDLFRALRGDTYTTFPGMESMFRFPLNQSHVTGVPIDGYDEASLERAIAAMPRAEANQVVVPVVLVPWTRFDDRPSDDYYRAKHCFLNHRLPSQFVAVPTITNKRSFKWTISNIGLALFAKMGGYPWKVQPRNENCLIVGVGQSHKRNENDEIDRYYAYSVLTDSSGLYESLKVLSHEAAEDAYLNRLEANLKRVFEEHATRFERFAIHTTFALRQNEMQAIERAIAAFRGADQANHEFVVLKFNDRSLFFGFSETANSMVPYESTYVQVAPREFLVWFEGLQFQRSAVSGRVGGPVHVQFIYPREPELSSERQSAYLQDALNLSGANWRGFNAKTLPVSVYYAQLIARYCKEFHRLGLPDLDLESLTPWFL